MRILVPARPCSIQDLPFHIAIEQPFDYSLEIRFKSPDIEDLAFSGKAGDRYGDVSDLHDAILFAFGAPRDDAEI